MPDKIIYLAIIWQNGSLSGKRLFIIRMLQKINIGVAFGKHHALTP